MIEYTGEIRPLNTDLSIFEKLELDVKPIVVKFLFEQPVGVQRLDKNLAMCLMPEKAHTMKVKQRR